MKRKQMIVSIAVLCALLVTSVLACQWGLPVPSTGTPAATQVGSQGLEPTPPQVVTRTPARGEEQAVDAPIILVFDQVMDKASVEAAFTVEPAIGGAFDWPDERTLRFTPAAAWQRETHYQVALTTAARSAAGLTLETEYTFRFSTIGYLEVAQVQPADGTEEVDMNAAVTVMFNRPVVPLTAISEQAVLPQPLTFEPAVEGSGEWLNTAIYLFRPAKGFAPATNYTARVKAGLTDTTGGVLAEDHVWTFTTKVPAVVRTLPDDGDIFVGPSETITVTFNQPMDHASAETHFSLVGTEGKILPGMFTWTTDEEDRDLMIFTPSQSLEMDTVYRGKVARGALAAAGERGTITDYSWRFTTVSLPRIVRTDPADGDKRVDPYTGLNVTFSSPMDPITLEPNLTIEYYDTVVQESGVITRANVYTYWRYYNAELYLSFSPRPSSEYTITFGANLAGRYGHKLGEPYTLHFTTRELDPMVYVNVPGWVGTYDANSPDGPEVIITYRNVDEVDFALYRLPREDFLRLDSYEFRREFRPDDRNLLRQWSAEADAPLNQVALLPMSITLGTGEWLTPGLYCLEVGAPGLESDEFSRHVMIVATANAMLKQTETEALVWATDLSDGDVLAQAPVVLYDQYGQVLAEGTTDGDGVFQAEFNKRDMWDRLVAFVGEEGEKEGPPGTLFAVAGNLWRDGISPWDFNLNANFYSQPYQGYLYTDRPIYRPGQTVYFKSILRADDDALYSLPVGVKDVQVTINDSQGREIYNEDLSINDMGTVHGELKLDEEASLGYYDIWAYLDDYSFVTSFQVAEYRKPEFQVSVEADQDAYAQGDTINVTAEATYYFGGPVANADVTWAVLSRSYFFQWDGPGYYNFTDYEWEEREEQYYGGYGYLITQGQGTTDDQGRFTFQVPADIAKEKTSQVFTIEATVTDVNNQQTSNRTEAVVHKGLFYIGLAPHRYVGTVGQEQTVDVLAVDWEQEPVPEVPLTVVFNKHEWFSVQQQEDDGRYRWTWETKDTPVYTTTVTTDDQGKAVASFVPEEGGSYKVVAFGHDERENEVRSATYLWVSSREYVSWRQENNDRIELIADKKSYQVGDVAQILVPSPYQGQVKALLTVERGHVISHEVVTLKSNSELLEIPITEDHIPNVYVSVFIVKGQDETAPVASFKMGCIALPVSTAEKELTVTITPDRDMSKGEHYGPGETVTYGIQSTDHSGKGVPTELSLSLVDLSVLALAESGQTSLLDFFYGERGLGIGTSAALVYSVDRLNETVEARAKGGDGAEEAAAPGAVRSRFPDTAYWNPVVRTDENGQATVEVELPDTLTTWRLGAKGITADTLVGETNVDVLSTKDLLVRSVAPRFFVTGDQAQLSAVVHNNTAEPLVAAVDLAAEGLTIEGGAQNVNIPAHDKVTVNWQVTVKDIEEVTLLFSANEQSPEATAGPFLSDALEITLPVYRYSTPEVVATAGQLEEADSRTEVIVLPQRLDPTQGELTVKLDPSLAAGMRDGLDYLEHYPYECVEQTVSRFLPNVLTFRALKELGIENAELEAKLPQQVGVGLQRLYAQQRYDGGWGWWISDESNSYLTAYVLFALDAADKAGFSVDEDVMDRAAAFLRSSLRQPKDIKAPWQGNTQAFILYVLAEYGEGDLGRTVNLYEKRELLGNYGKAYLAMALNLLQPDERTRVDSLLSDLTSAAILSATGAHWEETDVDYWTMNTDTRSTAIVLDAFTRLNPDNALLPNVVRWLMVARQAEGHWETTQETAWALISLTDYMVMTGELKGDYSFAVYLNGESLGEGTVTPENVDEQQQLIAEIAKLIGQESNRLLIERMEPTGDQTGEGRLYYSAYLRYYLPVEDVTTLSRGVIVARQYTIPDKCDDATRCPPVTGADIDDVVQVKLTVVAPNDLYYLVVEDPLPAGCEALDLSLKTTSVVGQPPEMEQKEGDEWYAWGWWWFSHTDLRDEKAVLFATYLPRGVYEYTYLIRASIPGEFLTMPSLAYEMYFPEVWGRSDGAKFVVEATN
jgi:uncharacterized protein YfaS (alpha-2-macroglobulin family)